MQTQAQIRLVNRSARKILEAHQWSFDERDDGRITFAAPITATESLLSNGDTAIAYTGGTSAQHASITGQVSRLLVTNSVGFTDTSYKVVSAGFSSGTVSMTISPGFLGSSMVLASLKIYANEMRLPDTVRRVLSVRNVEDELRLHFVERHIDFDTFVPRATDSFQEPTDVYIGGTVTETYDTATETEGPVGPGIMVWPPPAAKTVLDYSYVYRHPDMSAATDTLSGVPEHIVDLVVDRAFLYALTSGIQNDPDRARHVRSDLKDDLAMAIVQDRRQPNRRRVPRPFGSVTAGPVNFRWDTKEIPTP